MRREATARLLSLLLAPCAWLLIALLSAGIPAFAIDPAHVEALAKGGATELALRRVEQGQSDALPVDEWVAWEKARLAVYTARRDWDALAQRVERLPGGLPGDFVRHALTRAAEARLAAADPAGARRFLRRLIWQEQAEPGELPYLRRLIIRSYLMEDNLDDALAALQRYKQDYRAQGEAWQLLHAEILLRAGQARGALEELAGLQSREAQLLRQLAALRAGDFRPRDVIERAEKLAAASRRDAPTARRAWVLVAKAARLGRDPATRVRALEQALGIRGENDALYRADADELWEAYDTLAESLGNAARLLVGEDEAWLAKAASYERKSPSTARALYAFTGRTAHDPEARAAAHQRLAASLLADGLTETLKTLYTRSARYAALDTIPLPVRYRLADVALAEYDIALAANLIRNLDTPPEGEDNELWRLRRARILIYAGELPPALAMLNGLLDGTEALAEGFAERFLQVMFDLQTAGQHQAAIPLLESLYARVDNERMQREILFWLADSHAALGHYPEAAELYLRSAATRNGALGADPWGDSARYQAAEALGKAGLHADARNVYLELLRATTDPRRRMQIERRIQQLWLKERSATTP